MDYESYFLQGMSDGFKKEAGVKEGLKALMSKVVQTGKAAKTSGGGLLGRLLKGRPPAVAKQREA